MEFKVEEETAVAGHQTTERKHPKIRGDLSGLLKQSSIIHRPSSIDAPSQTTGILLLALGHPYYGEMAANLAMSLKFSGCPAIHLVHSVDSIRTLSPEKRGMFDSMAECPAEAYTKNGKTAYFKAKTWMYDLSPFEQTVFLDADMLWIANRERSIHNIIASLADVDFTIQNRQSWDLADANSERVKWMWGDVRELRKRFSNQGKLYSLHSEFVWFKKCPKVQEYFGYVKEVFDNPEIKASSFAGDIADEFAFAYACLLTGMKPHAEPFHPVYWVHLDSKEGKTITRLKEKFQAISFGGKTLDSFTINQYRTMVKAYGMRMGIRNPHTIQPKRRFLPERKSM